MMDTPVAGERGSSELVGIARFTFHEGKVEDFKRLSAQRMEIVRTKDTGTCSTTSSSLPMSPRRSSSSATVTLRHS